ncbi:DUF6907 domain-containing protein [Streptomyces sp. H27-H5]|uniref:DUF6907 domain-containing protein n=1 Tax=Streptomyces sp. H27-H5 TaxID=2996460 RepID=UPI0022721929|nr:hypothetical protein [Streptomyces sp. H27-H5]MCY0962784.1 hypothetical protein [Streptomyces sp. H27-H5]
MSAQHNMPASLGPLSTGPAESQNIRPRTHAIRLLDAAAATLTVTCPPWCESDHQEDLTHGTYLADFAHRGGEQGLAVRMPDGRCEEVLVTELTQYPFGSDLQAPSVLLWPVLGYMSETQLDPLGLVDLAEDMRRYAGALDLLAGRLEQMRDGLGDR